MGKKDKRVYSVTSHEGQSVATFMRIHIEEFFKHRESMRITSDVVTTAFAEFGVLVRHFYDHFFITEEEYVDLQGTLLETYGYVFIYCQEKGIRVCRTPAQYERIVAETAKFEKREELSCSEIKFAKRLSVR